MIETEWTAQTPDGATIYGVTNQADNQPSDKVIVMAHGLTCDRSGHPFPMTAREFLKNGYDVIRFDFYSGEEGARNILECTLQTHADDLQTVLNEKTGIYKNIFLVGHSYGGATIMVSNPDNVKAVSLWDPSYNRADETWAKDITETLPDGRIVLKWGTVSVFSKEMWEEEKKYNMEHCADLSRRSRFPIQVIHCGRGELYEYGESWHTHCPQETDYVFMENATHCFDNFESVDQLVGVTLSWFEKFS